MVMKRHFHVWYLLSDTVFSFHPPCVSFTFQDRWKSAACLRSSTRSIKQTRRWLIPLCQTSCSPSISPSSTTNWWNLCWPEHRWALDTFTVCSWCKALCCWDNDAIWSSMVRDDFTLEKNENVGIPWIIILTNNLMTEKDVVLSLNLLFLTDQPSKTSKSQLSINPLN